MQMCKDKEVASTLHSDVAERTDNRHQSSKIATGGDSFLKSSISLLDQGHSDGSRIIPCCSTHGVKLLISFFSKLEPVGFH